MALEFACFTAVGTIAVQGVRRADPKVGDVVVVIGLGLLGLITVQILQANGCRVIGLDIDASAIRKAREIGADVAVHRSEADAVNIVRSFTQGLGADSVIITAAAATSDPVRIAGELSRERGRVVVVGDVGLEIPRASYYRKELELRLSRSTGPGRYDPEYEEQGRSYPAGNVRWTETRNMQEFLRLIAEEKLDFDFVCSMREAGKIPLAPSLNLSLAALSIGKWINWRPWGSICDLLYCFRQYQRTLYRNVS